MQGSAGTAWSGGDEWLDEQIVTGSEAGLSGKAAALWEWASQRRAAGRTVFPAADVLGVDKEQGFNPVNGQVSM